MLPDSSARSLPRLPRPVRSRARELLRPSPPRAPSPLPPCALACNCLNAACAKPRRVWHSPAFFSACSCVCMCVSRGDPVSTAVFADPLPCYALTVHNESDGARAERADLLAAVNAAHLVAGSGEVPPLCLCVCWRGPCVSCGAWCVLCACDLVYRCMCLCPLCGVRILSLCCYAELVRQPPQWVLFALMPCALLGQVCSCCFRLCVCAS